MSSGTVPSASGGDAVRGIRILDERGGFTAPCRVSWGAGVFSLGGRERETDLAPTSWGADELWLIPGLVDAHLHAAWHAFDADDRARLSEAQTLAATERALALTLAAGFTSARDAGGLAADALRTIPSAARPRTQLSVRIIDRRAADEAGGLDRAVEAVLEAGARWVKLSGTAGIGSPPGAGLDPVFTATEVRDAAVRAGRAGAGVMVHAWGGRAIDDAIEAGALSIEHGIFLSDQQAARAAERDMTLVPTLRIYRLVQRMIDAGSLPAALRARVDEAVGAHPRAVLRARDAGLRVALGTDYGTPQQHGANAREFDALVGAGLTPGEALLAATRSGAQLLARVAPPDPAAVRERTGAPDPAALAGRIAEGAVADGVILRRDPSQPGALSDPESIAAVLLGGSAIDPAALRARLIGPAAPSAV